MLAGGSTTILTLVVSAMLILDARGRRAPRSFRGSAQPIQADGEVRDSSERFAITGAALQRVLNVVIASAGLALAVWGQMRTVREHDFC